MNPATNRVYVANTGSGNVTVIDGATNRVVLMPLQLDPAGVDVVPTSNFVLDAIPVELDPAGVAVHPETRRVYVANRRSASVSVIDGTANRVIARIPVELDPAGVAVHPETRRVYVANRRSGSVSVIDAATNRVVATIPVELSLAPGGAHSLTARACGTDPWPDALPTIEDRLAACAGSAPRR